MIVESPYTWTHDPVRLRVYMQDHDLTAMIVAGLVGVDGRTVRRWTASRHDPDSRPMPYAAWWCMRWWIEEADELPNGLEAERVATRRRRQRASAEMQQVQPQAKKGARQRT